MVHLKPDRFPRATYQKLHSCNAGPFQILRRLDSNVYLLDLPTAVQLSPIFNVADLTAYLAHLQEASSPKPAAKLPTDVKPCKEIKDILDDHISTRCGTYRKFLVKWKHHPCLIVLGSKSKKSNSFTPIYMNCTLLRTRQN